MINSPESLERRHSVRHNGQELSQESRTFEGGIHGQFFVREGTPRIILVTGIPRSGTTAVGRVLSLGYRVGVLHEPFNEHVGLTKIERYFEFLDDSSLDLKKLDSCVRSIRALKLEYKGGVFPNETGIRKTLKFIISGRAINSYRLCRWNPFLNTIVWKDPFAGLVADYLSRAHDIDVLVTARSPWAVAASFKRMGWGFDLNDMVQRKKVCSAPSLDCHLNTPDRSDSVPNSTMLWNLIYYSLLDWSRSNQRIHFVNLNDIILNPIETYERAYSALGLPWSASIRSKIRRAYSKRSGRNKPKEKKAHDANRDVRMINTYWQDILTEKEFKMAYEVNHELWEEMLKVCL
jgi:hypothetical protein